MKLLEKIFRRYGKERQQKIPACLARSIAGNRPENQDNYLMLSPENGGGIARMLKEEGPQEILLAFWPARMRRLAVADGMGGHRQGREIAEMAVHELAVMPAVSSLQQMREMVYCLHERLQKAFAVSDDKRPGTTLVVADIDSGSGRGIVASIGDSRAWKIAGGEAALLTRDHSAIEFAYRDGLVDVEEYRCLSRRQNHQLAQALGNGSVGVVREADGRRYPHYSPRIVLELSGEQRPGLPIHPDIVEFTLKEGEGLFLATDGLWNGQAQAVWQGSGLHDFMSMEWLQWQIANALDKGSNDNITVAVYRQPKWEDQVV